MWYILNARIRYGLDSFTSDTHINARVGRINVAVNQENNEEPAMQQN